MKARIYKVHPDSNFLSSDPAKTIINFKEITVLKIPNDIEIKGSKSLIISPYKMGDGIKTKVARDTSWGGDLNLRSWATTNEIIEFLSDFNKVYLLGALESLNDIRPLLKALRVWMINDTNRKAVFSSNLSSAEFKCFRDWSYEEAEDLFRSSGFEISKNQNELILSCSEEYYQNFLNKNNLPAKYIQ